MLEAQNVSALQGEPIDAVIAIAQPTGERAILGSDLIWRTGDTIAYVGQSQWSNRAADALQQVLAETIIRQGRFRAVDAQRRSARRLRNPLGSARFRSARRRP